MKEDVLILIEAASVSLKTRNLHASVLNLRDSLVRDLTLNMASSFTN